ncbi:MAG TPA: L,D-transpeptidase family protein [Allosphingosinicella sp.]|jgi:lipoprotein-anchoring transpeptidase ErfK/SrfK|uniref:L,D-transpeptidase family protein n=1 Tax=Allosphingosinicella sp. TaxID=2823234 RepID=UPI002F2AD76A
MAAMFANPWLIKGLSTLAVLGAAFIFSDELTLEQPPAPAPAPATAVASAAPAPLQPQPAPLQPTSPTGPTVAPTLASSTGGFAVRGVLAPDRPMGAGDYAWEDAGVPQGELTIVVDLAWQRLYAYRAGVEIGRAAILYGADDKPTPTGAFKILQKKKDHISNLYGAPMPFMLRLTNDGIAIHGSEVEDGYATHGCIGVPDEFAQLLFKEAKIGSKVLITKEWMRQTYQALDAPSNEV